MQKASARGRLLRGRPNLHMPYRSRLCWLTDTLGTPLIVAVGHRSATFRLGMYSPHSSLVTPPANAVLWRYMEFTKLVSLLDRQALHFARADQLGDPFEGSVTAWTQTQRPLIYQDFPPGTVQQMPRLIRALQHIFYVNCWHENDRESPALWNIYSRYSDGIVVQTDFGSLRDSLQCSDNIYIGRVSYIDYDMSQAEQGDMITRYFFKRSEFRHEQEVRAVCHVLPPGGGELTDSLLQRNALGEYRQVDLSLLVKKIVVSPSAQDWFVELVQSVVARYELPASVERSSLNAPPRW